MFLGFGHNRMRRESPLVDAKSLDPLLERIGDARVVLLGEASHGTHEYDTWRARISQRLIVEKGVGFVEGDWPDFMAVTQALSRPETPMSAVLGAFRR